MSFHQNYWIFRNFPIQSSNLTLPTFHSQFQSLDWVFFHLSLKSVWLLMLFSCFYMSRLWKEMKFSLFSVYFSAFPPSHQLSFHLHLLPNFCGSTLNWFLSIRFACWHCQSSVSAVDSTMMNHQTLSWIWTSNPFRLKATGQNRRLCHSALFHRRRFRDSREILGCPKAFCPLEAVKSFQLIYLQSKFSNFLHSQNCLPCPWSTADDPIVRKDSNLWSFH